jgi:hypothetical protein
MPRRTLFLLFLNALALLACSNSEADMTEKSSTDIAMLAKFIVLDPKPEAVEWSVMEDAAGSGLGPADSAVVALMTYSPADFEKVERSLSAAGGAEGGLMRKAPKWLPGSVTKKSAPAADGAIDFGTRAVSAHAFASSPYSDGFAVTLTDERKVLAYLYSK